MGQVQPQGGTIINVVHDPFNLNEQPQTMQGVFKVAPDQRLFIDLSYIGGQENFTKVQTIFFDNKDFPYEWKLINDTTQQRLIFPKNKQGYLPVLSGIKPRFYLSHNAPETLEINLQFMNFMLSQGTW